jgi:hypothetical protein
MNTKEIIAYHINAEKKEINQIYLKDFSESLNPDPNKSSYIFFGSESCTLLLKKTSEIKSWFLYNNIVILNEAIVVGYFPEKQFTNPKISIEELRKAVEFKDLKDLPTGIV